MSLETCFLPQAHEIAGFLLPMLEYYPNRRATAEEMLRHPWLHSEADLDVTLYLQALQDNDSAEEGQQQ